jgi:hypothetical protein
VWPIFPEHAATERIDLYLPPDWTESSALKAKFKPTDAGEERADRQEQCSNASASVSNSIGGCSSEPHAWRTISPFTYKRNVRSAPDQSHRSIRTRPSFDWYASSRRIVSPGLLGGFV